MDSKLRTLFTLVAALAAALAVAQDTAASFATLDKDKDGMISVTEARADKTASAQFVAADKNQDGYLSPAEFASIAAH